MTDILHMDLCGRSSRGVLCRDEAFSVKPFGRSHRIRSFGIIIDEAASPEQIRLIRQTLKVFPDPFLEAFVSGRSFHVVSREEFDRLPHTMEASFSAKMGIKISGMTWYLREDTLSASSAHSFSSRLWYAMSALVANELEGEPEFDRLRFQANFVRYLRGRLGNALALPWIPLDFFLKGVDPLYQIFFDLLAEAPDFSHGRLRELFREALVRSRSPHKLAPSRRRMAAEALTPWSAQQAYAQLVAGEYSWHTGGGNVLQFSLQNAKDRTRPESSHRFSMHYYNDPLNELLGQGLGRLFPGTAVDVVWSPGLVGSYDTATPNGVERETVLLGSLFDLNLKYDGWTMGLHSYLGLPVSLREREDDRWAPQDLCSKAYAGRSVDENPCDREGPITLPNGSVIWNHPKGMCDQGWSVTPQWEVGFKLTDPEKRFFLGTMLMVPFPRTEGRYFGLILRWQPDAL